MFGQISRSAQTRTRTWGSCLLLLHPDLSPTQTFDSVPWDGGGGPPLLPPVSSPSTSPYRPPLHRSRKPDEDLGDLLPSHILYNILVGLSQGDSRLTSCSPRNFQAGIQAFRAQQPLVPPRAPQPRLLATHSLACSPPTASLVRCSAYLVRDGVQTITL